MAHQLPPAQHGGGGKVPGSHLFPCRQCVIGRGSIGHLKQTLGFVSKRRRHKENGASLKSHDGYQAAQEHRQ